MIGMLKQLNKDKKVMALILTVAVLVVMIFPEVSLAETTTGETPTEINNAKLKWERSLGTGYTNAPTPPVVMGKYVYTFSSNYVYKLEKDTGVIVSNSEKLNGAPGYATTKLATNGSLEDEGDAVYVFMTSNYKDKDGYTQSKSQVVKINIKDMIVAWQSKEFLGQNTTPLTYNNGMIYGGTWGDENNRGTYFSIKDLDGSIAWEYPDTTSENNNLNEGFYWAGACISEQATANYAVFGSDGIYSGGNADGTQKYTSTLYSVDTKTNGELNDANVKKAGNIDGQIRSTIKKDKNGNLYFTTNAGWLYKFSIGDDGILTEEAKIDIGAKDKIQSVNTPVIVNVLDGEKLYVGNDAGQIKVLDLSKELQKEGQQLDTIATVGSAVKGEMLYSSSANCLYAATYKTPGGIRLIKLNSEGTAATQGNLFVPTHQNYGLSPITADEDGTIYYKNDSGYIMALQTGYDLTAPTMVSVLAINYNSIKVTWKPKYNIVKYQLLRSDGKVFNVSSTATSYIDKTVLTGKTYTYKVRGICSDGAGGTGVYSISKSAKTILEKTKVSTKAGKRKITVYWKAVSGAGGYYVYRSTKKNGKYKRMKTTLKKTWTNLKLRKGKKYYYKVKAYRNVSGKKVFSSWSNISYKKVK